MRYLKTGCCGCTLRKSTLVIGYTGLVCSILTIIANSAQLTNLPSGENKSLSRERDSLSKVLDDKNPRRLLGNIIGEAVSAVVNTLLVIGATKKNRWLMLPWIISGAIGIAVGVVASVVLIPLLLFSTDNNQKEGPSPAILIIFAVIILLLMLSFSFYLWFIVMSYFVELRTESTHENDVVVQMRITTNPKEFHSAADDAMP